MRNNKYQRIYNTPYQLKLPLEIEKIIEISDPVYTFCEVLNQIDLKRYLVVKENRTGRERFDSETLLKVILFAFMEHGYVSTREIEKLCKTDIRFMYLLNEQSASSHMTIDNFMNCCLADSIENIFKEINKYIFEQEQVDTEHIYIDGTKLEANANKYSWVWKKSSIKNRNKIFVKVSALLEEINKFIAYQGVRFDIRTEYAVEYMEEITANYIRLVNINPEKLVRGRGRRKTTEQRYYEKLTEYTEKLKKYAEHIRISGEHRNSYSKTDNGATFFRMKKDYMGNDRLLPGYNIQLGLCDEYIAVYDVKQYASDMDCFQPLMEKFKDIYHKYPQYPVADAGYGSFNNYLYSRPVRGNQFGRTEEMYQCEDCSDCQLKEQCCKCEGNRIVRINEELTKFHKEVLNNLNSTKGALLRMNRSIQAEGAFGIIKWNREYKRARRRGLKGVNFELALISCGFNLHKYHLKKQAQQLAA